MSTKTQLAEAREAYHQLLTGQAVVRIQREGRSVEYREANKSDLRAYISDLERELGTGARRRRPAGFSL